jgi:hypothetical protein
MTERTRSWRKNDNGNLRPYNSQEQVLKKTQGQKFHDYDDNNVGGGRSLLNLSPERNSTWFSSFDNCRVCVCASFSSCCTLNLNTTRHSSAVDLASFTSSCSFCSRWYCSTEDCRLWNAYVNQLKWKILKNVHLTFGQKILPHQQRSCCMRYTDKKC